MKYSRNRASLVGPWKWWKQKRDLQIDFLKKQGLTPEKSLLDYGCGVLRGGVPLINFLEKGKYCGFEICENRLKEARLELRDNDLESKEPVLVSDIEQVATKFDFIWSYQVFIHIPDHLLDVAISNIARLLKEDGVCFISINTSKKSGSWLEYPFVKKDVDFYSDAFKNYGLCVRPLKFSCKFLDSKMLRINHL